RRPLTRVQVALGGLEVGPTLLAGAAYLLLHLEAAPVSRRRRQLSAYAVCQRRGLDHRLPEDDVGERGTVEARRLGVGLTSPAEGGDHALHRRGRRSGRP